MTRTEHLAKAPHSTGPFATVRAFLHVQGIGAFKSRVLLLFFVVLAILAFAAAPAFAIKRYVPGVPSSFGHAGEGTSNGELKEPGGMAVNEVTLGDLGDVYVIDRDRGKYSVADFSSAGVERGRFEAPPGGFGDLRSGIAVDNSTDALDMSAGDVYVADREKKVIDKFSSTGSYLGQLTETTGGSPLGSPEGVAVDPSGDLWVEERETEGICSGKSMVDEFTDIGTFVKTFEAEAGDECGEGIAVDSSGNIYAIQSHHILKFEGATGTKLAEFGTDAEALAVDPSTESLVVEEHSDVVLYGPNPGNSSTPIETFAPGGSVAVNGERTVYVSQSEGGTVEVFDVVLFPAVTVEAAPSVAQTTATLGGTVDPDEAEASSPGEAALTGCRFEYGTEAGSFTNTAECSPAAASIVGEQHVSAQLSGLQGGTVYHYRLSATNAADRTEYSQELELLTTGPRISAEWVSDVASTSTTFGAQVNPREEPTTYYFQYSTAPTTGCTASPTACTDVPVAPGAAIGSGDSDVQVSQQVQGLEPNTVYHYRVIAHNSFGGGSGTTVEGPDHTFTTQGPGGPLVLPDGRAWEMVSPVQKLGAQVIPAQNALIQASKDGGAISYYLTGPFGANPAGNVHVAQAMSTRTSTGWATKDIATPHTGVTGTGEIDGEYKLFSPDLSRSLVEPFGATPLSSEATEKTPYLRDDETGLYTPLVDPADVPPGTEFGATKLWESGLSVKIVTATPDLSHVVLESPRVALTANAQGAFYEWSAGQLQPIPLGGIGSHTSDIRHAISNDGSLIFGGGDVADMTTGEVTSVGGEFQIASSDGSLVITSGSSSEGLNAYNVITRTLTRVTVPVNSGEAAGVRGYVLGAAEDGSYVYFVATGVLTAGQNAAGDEPVSGADNLYVERREVHGSTEAWKPSFIATLSTGSVPGVLSTGDAPDWEARNLGGGYEQGTRTVEVSPDGRYLAFMSERSLTGYDNRDASGGEPDEEVYRYHAPENLATESGTLICASCDPTGARPAGWLEPEGSLSDPLELGNPWGGRWVAATIPGLTEMETPVQALYEPRYMLDDGRLFFDSHDALVPQDVNGVVDVYEYAPGGTGSCAVTSNGCVALLSGGTGPEESAFVDAGASGDDVFFVTADKLVPQDLGNEYDMYDAHVCSTEAPCPASVATPPPCDTADSCKPAQAAQPGVFGPSGSATFSGAGNSTPPPPAVVKPAVKSLTKAQKLAKALKACRKKPKKKRASCQKQARKRYGASKAKKSAKGRK